MTKYLLIAIIITGIGCRRATNNKEPEKQTLLNQAIEKRFAILEERVRKNETLWQTQLKKNEKIAKDLKAIKTRLASGASVVWYRKSAKQSEQIKHQPNRSRERAANMRQYRSFLGLFRTLTSE